MKRYTGGARRQIPSPNEDRAWNADKLPVNKQSKGKSGHANSIESEPTEVNVDKKCSVSACPLEWEWCSVKGCEWTIKVPFTSCTCAYNVEMA